MKTEYQRLIQAGKAGLILILGMTLCACVALPGGSATTWEEEVLLHDGRSITVSRRVERGGGHEIGQEPSIRRQTLSFTFPGTSETATWEDSYAQDIGGASFLPMLLELDQGSAYLVAHPMGCLSYNKWGRPNPPYVVFQYVDKTWTRIPLESLPAVIKTPNLIFSSPEATAAAAKKNRDGVIPSGVIRALYEEDKRPEFRTIQREPYAGPGGIRCGAMVGNGKGKWLGTGWFQKQPSYEACLNYCQREDFDTQRCPCNIIFKGAN